MAMTKQQFLSHCLDAYGTGADHPFSGDFETAVLRHGGSGKWYALVMHIPRRKRGIESDGGVDVVNLKLPPELFGSFDAKDGVYPAYHMNKRHWISVVLADAREETVRFLTRVSFVSTKGRADA